jgi:hypothetical protein
MCKFRVAECKDGAYILWSNFSTLRGSHIWTLVVTTSRFLPLFTTFRAANISLHEIAQLFIPSGLLHNYELCYYYYPKEDYAVRIELVRSVQFTFYILHFTFYILHYTFYVLHFSFHLVPFKLSIGWSFNNYSPHHKGQSNVKYVIRFLSGFFLSFSNSIPLTLHLHKRINYCYYTLLITIVTTIFLPLPLCIIVLTWRNLGVDCDTWSHCEHEIVKPQGTNQVTIHD